MLLKSINIWASSLHGVKLIFFFPNQRWKTSKDN